MKKLLAIIVLCLLWGSIGFAKIDAEKIKTIKCELDSIEKGGEKLDEEAMKKQWYEEGGPKVEKFIIKKNRIKSKMFDFKNLFIKDNIITGNNYTKAKTADEDEFIIFEAKMSILIDLYEMSALVKEQYIFSDDESVEEEPLISFSYLNCIAK
ncbi:hypothetical protein OAP71_03535 [Pelagibacteraceae bacterium]|nr:hypothetical protein [Pelagibacteraceae bacterium]